MRKKIIRNLAICNCLLVMLPNLAWAAEGGAAAADDTTLQEVVVTAVPLEKYLLTTSVITNKDIEAKGARNLAEVLEDVPGLNVHTGKKNNTSLDIRGRTVSDTKIFVDGVLINPLAKVTSSAAVDISMIPVDNIAKIEIIKGPAPVPYGTDVAGGIILITTKNGKDYQGGKVSLAGGSWGTFNGSVSQGGGDDKFNYYINAGSENTNGFTDNADRDVKYFNTKLNWKFKDNSFLTFTGGYSTTDKGVPNAIDPVTGKILSTTKGFWPGLNGWEFRDWDKSNLALTYGKKADNKLDYNIKVYRFTEKNGVWANGENYDPSSGLNSKISGGIYSGNYSTLRWNASYWDSVLNGVEFQGNLKLNALHTLTFGTLYNDIDWKKSNTTASDPSNPYNYSWLKYNNKRYGYYVQDNFLPNERTTITFGVRHDKNEVNNSDNNSQDNSATNAVVNVLYRLDKRNTLRGSFGTTTGFPSVEQLYSSSGGNPDLKPEEGKNYEIGLKHKFDDALTGDLAVFKNDITNMINKDPVTNKNRNLNKANIKGVELALNKKLTERCSSFINYTYLDATYLDTDGTTKFLSYTPRHHINYGLSYQADKGYKFTLTGHWVGERSTGDTYTAATGSKPASDTRSNKQLYPTTSGYHVVDLQIKRQINEKQDWYLTVNNIFDTQYEDELFYLAPGRYVIAGVDYKF